MKKNIRVAIMASLSAAALTLSACSNVENNASKSSNDSSSSSSNTEHVLNPNGDYNKLDRDQVQDGGELRLAISEIPEQLNDSHGNASGYARDIQSWQTPQFFSMEGDGTLVPNPAYVLDVKDEVKDGKTVVTYTMNPDAKFNDGTPIDVKAFVNNWQMLNGTDKSIVASSTDGYEQVVSVEPGKDDFQIVVTFETEYPWWKGIFTSVMHPAVNTPEVFNEAFINNPRPEWGAGPYVIDKFDPQAGIVTYKRNENWWGDTGKLDKITYRQMESQAEINAFQAGEIDLTGAGNKDNLAKVKGMGDKASIRKTLQPANSLLVLNSQAPLLGDIKVREAIVNGIDRSQIAAIRFNGLDYTETAPGSLFLYSNQEGYEDNFSTAAKFDPENAKKILDEAGWKEGADGIREKDGEKLSIRYILIGDSAISKAFAAALQKMMKDIGVDLKVEERPVADFSKVTSAKDFDMFFMAFGSNSPWGAAYFGQTYKSDSTLNLSGTTTEEMDKKIAAMQKLPTEAEQIKEGNKLEKEAFATFGLIPMYNGPQIIATTPGLANLGANYFAKPLTQDIGWAKDSK
ncbi:MAG: ABC transporter family substrate-binding protein [Corynebacterium sp.]|uniref:ABC transporter family substrate-binding protein n=1 Tax=Corynebacterium sp. TaxID=1720 RepID=UPI0026DA7B69|nr:ABC transporter family substrate-binding protein [Corynebacterium sp.]MDO4761766.1 ABC transporter family substrate-binding protein [Corynebacterium sp.]